MTTRDPNVLQQFQFRTRQGAPVDIRALQKVLGDDVDMQLSILRKFVVQTSEILASTISANEQRNADQVRFFAHKLKSSACTVGANHLSDICSRLEVAGRNADWANIEPLVGSMQSEASRVSDYIDAL
jgi:HPt (histidine-containing phosphotransfer) domain-containing protein